MNFSIAPPASAAEPRQDADSLDRRRAQARAWQLTQLMAQAPKHLALGAGLALVVWLGLAWAAPGPRVLAWALAVHTAQAGQWAVARAFARRGEPTLPDSGAWRRRYLAALGCSSLTWGLAAPWLWPTHASPQAMALLTAVLLVMTAAGAVLVAVVKAAIPLWLLPLLAPPIAWAWRQPGTAGQAVALVAAAALALTWCFAQVQHRLLQAAWQTQLDNDTLVRELRQQVALVERADREKSRFLASASHDLRQPMHALGLFAGALDKRLSGTALQPTVTHMMRAIDALDQSFDAMLDISKLDAGVVEPSLQSFPIRDLFRLLHMHCIGHAEAAGLSLRFKPGGKIVTSDPELLQRVLGNLVLNALRYTREGGVVVVVRQRQGFTSIEVWDTGVGISDDELPRVFDEFYQVANPGRNRSRGLGMGLAIVKRLVLLMGHRLEVRSHPGRGTVFRVLLKPTEMADMDNLVLGADTMPSPIDTGQTLLLIDDEESIRIGMGDFLRTWGYQVLTAGTIVDACAEVRRHAGVIDLVVSDMRLANREDGIAAVERVRQAYGAPLPALLITGDTSPEQVGRAHRSGHRVLFKPVRPRDLHAALRWIP